LTKSNHGEMIAYVNVRFP